MAEPRTEQEQRREDARRAFGEEPDETGRWKGGVEGVHSVASEGIHLVRDVATDTVRAVGDVGTAAVDATRHLLVEVADGVRDVITHIIPFRSDRHREPPPSERS